MLPIFMHHVELEEEENRMRELSVQRRTLRDMGNPFELPAKHFQRLFMLSKELCWNLIQDVNPHMDRAVRSSKLPVEMRILATLRFLATGSCQASEEYLTSISQQSISHTIAAIEHLAPQWLQFPQTANAKQAIKAGFMEKFGFPGTIGIIDGTHVAVLEPSQDQHLHLNRKGFHSKNCQIICDSDLLILSINARFGGAEQDSSIWRQSAVCDLLERSHGAGERGTWLVGDGGYPQEPWLMTPFPGAAAGSPEERYNAAHEAVRKCVERCIGTLKTRFRCLLKERLLSHRPVQVGTMVNVCAILHNMCIRAGLPLDEEIQYDDDDDDDDPLNHHCFNMSVLNEGVQTRNKIVQLYF